ncbi:MAG: 6-carboxytetrahydropterin synthase [Candidatus Hydrogenedentes bacterium]|nr:6-carboxytetrahydropterin synthase [Candidatus Hydrogenedentota bacterium]
MPNVHFGFEAAHFLPNVPEAHKCRRMHGHSFRVAVCAEKSNSLEPFLERIHHALDRRCLNRIVGLENATSEHVARWIWEQLEPRGVGMLSVTVAETCTARCVYRGEKKEQGPDKQPEAAALQVGNG